MAKITLPTNYRDDILNSSAEGKRKYVMSYNQDGTVSFEDVTPYEQVGSDFGAGDINTANEAINQSFDKNKLIKDLDTINALTEEGYAVDALSVKQITERLENENNESFNFGYLNGVRGFFTNPSRADDSFIPFSSAIVGTSEQTMTQNGYIMVNVNNMPENPTIIAYPSDVNGNRVLPCVIRFRAFNGLQYNLSITGDQHVMNAGTDITVGDDYIKFGFIGTWDVGYHMHYVIF